MFYYNTDKYDLESIEECIKEYYPIGLTKEFYKYPGLKKREDVIVDNIHETKNYALRWESFENIIKLSTGKEVLGTTYGQDPCFSASVIIGTFTAENLTRFKSIEFFISLIGKFYTVIGLDRNEIKTSSKKINSYNFLVVSPEAEYKDLFERVCMFVEAHFKDFRFVPFFIYAQKIQGLAEEYKMDQNFQTVFSVIFNRNLSFLLEKIEDLYLTAMGDPYFGEKVWIKKGYFDSGSPWSVYS